MNDSIETLELENKMLRARNERLTKEALAQPEQSTTCGEPVAWMVYTLDGTSVCVTDNPADFTPEHRALPLYTTPPQRTAAVGEDTRRAWVGLTDKQLNIIGSRWHLNLLGADEKAELFAFARAVEAAHGIKENT